MKKMEYIFGRFRILEDLGEGSVGKVYCALDTASPLPDGSPQKVALKILKPDVARKAGTERFKRQFFLVSLLGHPRVVRTLDMGLSGEDFWLTTEFIEGEPLARKSLPIHCESSAMIALQIAEGLEFIHSHGILHLDLKPENVFICEDGARILDFGIPPEQDGAICGTPAYMAPEIAKAEPFDQRADLYSLGIVFLEMLTGENPFAEKSARKAIEKQMRFEPKIPNLGKKNKPIESLLKRLLEKSPENRPPTAFSVKIALQDFLGIERSPGEGYFLPQGKFVDRENELATIFTEWNKLDRARIISICGDKGIGVSSLARRTAKFAESKGARVISIEQFSNPISATILQLGESKFHDSMKKHLPGLIGTIRDGVPKEFRERFDISDLSPPENIHELHNRFADFIEEISKIEPLFIYSPEGTDIDVWRVLDSSPAKILVLLERAEIGEKIEIRELPRKDVDSFIDSMFGKISNGENLKKEIFSRSNGDPSKLRENLREFISCGALFPGEERWEFRAELVPSEIPFEERWSRLSESEKFFASAVALSEKLPGYIGEMILEAEYFLASSKLLSAGMILEESIGDAVIFFPSVEFAKNADSVITSAMRARIEKAIASAFLSLGPDPAMIFEGAKHLERAGDPAGAFASFFESGSAFMSSHKYESAEKALKSAVHLLEYSPEPDTTVKALKRFALARKYLGDFEGARESYYRAIAISEVRGDKTQTASIYSDIGVTFFEAGDTEKAIEFYDRALNIHSEIENEKGKLLDLVNLGGAYQVEKDFGRAQSYYTRAMEIAEKLDHKLSLCAINLNLGEIFLMNGNYSDALTLILESASIGRDNRFEQFYFEALLALARLYRIQGRTHLAWRAIDEASEKALQIGRRAQAKTFIEKSALSRISGKIAEAKTAIAEASSAIRQLGDEEKSNLLLEIALLSAIDDTLPTIAWKMPQTEIFALANDFLSALNYLRIGDNTSAERAFLKCLETSKKLDMEEIFAESAIKLAWIHSAKKEYKQALDIVEQTRSSLGGKNPFPLARLALISSSLYYSLGDTSASRSALSEAKSRASELSNETLLEEISSRERELSIPQRRENSIEKLLPIIKALNSTLETDELLGRIVDATLDITGAERGILFVIEGNGEIPIVARDAQGRDIPKGDLRYSNSLIRSVIETRKPVLSESIHDDSILSSRSSIIDLAITMALCSPIIGADGSLVGIVYADSRIGKGNFDEETLDILSALCDQMAVALRNAERFDALVAEKERISAQVSAEFGSKDIIGKSPAIMELRTKLATIAKQDISVLITGETGTGKDLVARTIHSESARKDAPFIALNCAALPATLLESELFGYEKGAFTGADRRHIGKFEQANGGTVFLDEIGEMPVELQAKLLRVLENNTFTRLGGENEIKVDVRFISATNLDPELAVSSGKLRSDLYYRIAPITVHLPPLRERREDIPLLCAHFIAKSAEKFGRPVDSISRKALDILVKYEWNGNVRELASAIEEAVIFSPVKTIRSEDLPGRISKSVEELSGRSDFPKTYSEMQRKKSKVVEDFIIATVKNVLERNGWNITKAAEEFGINRTRLHQIMNRYGIERKA